MAIRGLIFDFGGVIIDMRWDVARDLEQAHGLEHGTLLRTLYGCDEWREVELGRGDVQTWREVAHRALEAAAGGPLPPLHQEWRDSWRPIRENLDLIRSLRPPYRTAVLSNADVTLEDRLRDGFQIHTLFDVVVCSAVVQMAKPDPRVYLLTAQRLGLSPQECLFVDDSERNVTAAREVGMAAVHYLVHHGHDLAAQLAELGVGRASAG